MTFTPDSEVRLLNAVPLNNSYEHTLKFNSKSEQTSFFLSKSQHTFTQFTYVRESSAVVVSGGRDEFYLSNYIMYRNKNFTDKWFYGFITKVEYVNPNATKIYFEIDAYQTWQFDIDFKESFVVREHRRRWQADGLPYVNTNEEDLNYGEEYETVSVTQYVPHGTTFFLVIVSQKRMDVNSKEIDPVINGSVQPLTYYVVPFKMDGTVPAITVDGQNQVISPVEKVLLALYKWTTAVNNISALYITESIGVTNLAFNMQEFEPVDVQESGEAITVLRVKNVKTYKKLTKNFGSKYDGFKSVTESKLLMYPYTVTVLTDMKGSSQIIKNEFIQGTDLEVDVRGSIGISNKISYNVKNYKVKESDVPNSSETALENGIINDNPNDVPIITDLLSAYFQGNKNALQNQKLQTVYNTASGMAGAAFRLSPKGVADAGASGYFQLQGMLAKQKDLEAVPPQVKQLGGNTAFEYGNGMQGLYIIKKQITAEWRNRLSDFFRMYGYKLNETKVPEMHSRASYNFVHTIGANISGNIPADDLQVIKRMFDNGVTLWHGDWIGDYGRANDEI